MRHGDVFHLAENQNRRGGIDGEGQPRAPIFDEERGEDADHQQAVRDQVERELRKEVREFGHVAVNAFDQFARRAIVVKAHVEIERVLGQFGAQSVGGAPGHVLAKIFHRHRDSLLQERDADEGEGCPREDAERLARQRVVNEGAHDLRREDPQADAAEEQDGEQGKPSLLRTDVVAEEVPVGCEREVHRFQVSGVRCEVSGFTCEVPRFKFHVKKKPRCGGAPWLEGQGDKTVYYQSTGALRDGLNFLEGDSCWFMKRAPFCVGWTCGWSLLDGGRDVKLLLNQSFEFGFGVGGDGEAVGDFFVRDPVFEFGNSEPDKGFDAFIDLGCSN